jgi:hypothetical protein
MKTIRKVNVIPVLVEYIPEKNKMEQDKIYISVKYKTASHICLCGCGELTVTPLWNDGWTATINNGKLSMCPSIGNFSFPCKSHYVINDSVANFV